MSLAVVILNHLPVKKLEPTLKSASFADEILVIHDSLSPYKPPRSDQKTKVVSRPLNKGFAAQRNLALKKVSSDWVLFLDSDEVVSSRLKKEILQAVNSPNYQGYLIPRQDVILGQELKYGETGQIKLLRLARRGQGEFSRSVHETWKIKGRVGEIKTPLLHLKGNLTSNFIQRIIKYAPLDIKDLEKENKTYSPLRLLIFPIAKFIQNYIVRRGFLDGTLGIFHAYLMSIQSLSVRVFQWQALHLRSKAVKL
jgi:glycosyltransferase involved in cell wall biosynthesis